MSSLGNTDDDIFDDTLAGLNGRDKSLLFSCNLLYCNANRMLWNRGRATPVARPAPAPRDPRRSSSRWCRFADEENTF